MQVFEAQLLSLVSEGVFQAFPNLRVSILEIGFTWLPTFLWRIDKEWKGMRREIPWVNRSSIEIVRDNVRLSVAPLDADSAEEVVPVIKWLGSEDLLMFASDYPHMHDHDLGVLLAAAPETMCEKLMSETARSWYRPRRKSVSLSTAVRIEIDTSAVKDPGWRVDSIPDVLPTRRMG